MIIKRLQNLFSEFTEESVSRLDEVYTQDVEFVDPVHTIHGSLALKNYLRRMARNLSHYRVRYTDTLLGTDSAYLSWEMDFAHPKIKGGKPITLTGITHIRFTHKIYYHEDCYDLGALLYEHVPVLGVGVRALKKNLASPE